MPPASLLILIPAYLIGSIPFGFLIARAKGIDIRTQGSGNIGATNVGRVLGKKWGVLCFLLDFLKGLGPALGAGYFLGTIGIGPNTAGDWRILLLWLGAAAAAVVGHMFPVWLKFKGGKGVATAFGVLLGVYPVLTVAAAGSLLIWSISARMTRMVGISSCIAAGSLPLIVLAEPVAVLWPYLLVAGVLALLVIFRHRGNIARTFAGTEPKFGDKGKSSKAAEQQNSK